MRSKPHKMQDDASLDGEIHLPDDLQLLGEQLRDDAARLAKVYPSGSSSPPRRRVGWSRRVTVVAASAALVVVGVWSIARQGNMNPSTPRPGDVAGPMVVPRSTLGRAVVPAIVRVSREATQTHSDAAPAIWFYELNAPEQEALLDLWEQKAPKSSELSF